MTCGERMHFVLKFSKSLYRMYNKRSIEEDGAFGTSIFTFFLLVVSDTFEVRLHVHQPFQTLFLGSSCN